VYPPIRSPILAGACAIVVCALAACGGGGGGSHPASRAIRGNGFVFQAPYSWHVKLRGNEVVASPKPISTELVSVSVFPLLHPYTPALFGAVRRELDAEARQLAKQQGGSVQSSAAALIAGIRSHQYELGYPIGGQDVHERISFVLRGMREFELLCRWSGSEPTACTQLEQTFTPT
jgi:hypothetical protein